MMTRLGAAIFLASLQLVSGRITDERSGDIRRPFYIIAHMANSIPTMDLFLREGANAVELDVTFEPNGAAWWVHHGVPCDYFRVCHESTQLVDYLQAAATRNITLIFLDLKSYKLSPEAKEFAGVDLALKLSGHFFDKGGQQTNVVLSVPYVTEKQLLASFIEKMKSLKPEQLSKISYDVSENPDFSVVGKMFRDLNVTSAWQGDGVTNWFEPFRGFSRVRDAVELRDQGNVYIKKVYRWTVDYKGHIRQLIDLGIDGVMTNNPSRAYQVVRDLKEIRLAGKKDNINDIFSL
ncbi:sphingomyelin phosphodiesterase D [Galendromus occidentalis]|uniref:Sphingomyelin phosphodiesterase D n=1 Tax=Galendromus occidentalis TaxID=34638 RepID=A0AAJ6QRU6_9ACAR|nr:sphingomyelin phosphodiesterase D [Galendromus occidentalis]